MTSTIAWRWTVRFIQAYCYLMQYHLSRFRMWPIQFIKYILTGRKQAREVMYVYVGLEETTNNRTSHSCICWAFSQENVSEAFRKFIFQRSHAGLSKLCFTWTLFLLSCCYYTFQKETLLLKSKSRENRKIKNNMEEDEYVKLTPEFKEEIEDLFNLSSKPNNV